MANEKKTNDEELNASDTNDAILVKEAVQHPQEVPFMLPVGSLVTVNKSTLEGVISGYDLSDDKKTLSYLVDYLDEGEKHQRAFLPHQITKK